jgi:hypothetical protein
MELEAGRKAAVRAPDVRALSIASGLGRLAIGVGIFAAPRRAFSALGFREVDDVGVTLARLAGARDIVLAVATLLALDDPDRLRAANLANAAADGGDAVSFALALRRTDQTEAARRGLAAAVPATIAGLWVARRLRG